MDLRRIKLLDPEVEEHRYDCERIQRVLADSGYAATLKECHELWRRYSESVSAGWMCMAYDDDDQVFHRVNPYFEEAEDDE